MDVSRQINIKAKKLTGRVTKPQKQRLLQLMKAHPSVGRGQYTAECSSQQHEDCWKTVAAELNSMVGGNKTDEQWKRCWIDWKSAVKKHYGQIKRFNNKTANRPSLEGPKPLEKIEEEIIPFFSNDLVEGDGRTPEAGFYDDEEVFSAEVGTAQVQSTEATSLASISEVVPVPSTVEAETMPLTAEVAPVPSAVETSSVPSIVEASTVPSVIEAPTVLSTAEVSLEPPTAIPPSTSAYRRVSSLQRALNEAKTYTDQQNNAVVNELKNINQTMLKILKEMIQIKEKLK